MDPLKRRSGSCGKHAVEVPRIVDSSSFLCAVEPPYFNVSQKASTRDYEVLT